VWLLVRPAPGELVSAGTARITQENEDRARLEQREGDGDGQVVDAQRHRLALAPRVHCDLPHQQAELVSVRTKARPRLL